MNEQQLFNELKKLFTDNALKKVKESIIFKEDDGSVNIYDTYNVRQEPDGYQVLKYGTEIIKLSSLPIAVTYCTFDRLNRINQLFDIERLDQKLLDADIKYKIHKRLYDNAKNDEDKALYSTKMHEDYGKKRRTKQYLENYINQAKNYQQKIFESLA